MKTSLILSIIAAPFIGIILYHVINFLIFDGIIPANQFLTSEQIKTVSKAEYLTRLGTWVVLPIIYTIVAIIIMPASRTFKTIMIFLLIPYFTLFYGYFHLIDVTSKL